MTFIPILKIAIRGGYTYSMTLALPRKVYPLLLVGGGAFLIAASAYFILESAAPKSSIATIPVEVNFPAPELVLMDTEDMSHSLAAYHGQVVLVNLWATWCPPCKEEMPALQSFYNKYKEQGFVVIAINDGDPTADVLEFVKDYRLTFPVWLDPTYIATEQAFKTLTLPSSYVIDRTGTIQLQWMGGISLRALEQYVAPLLTESP